MAQFHELNNHYQINDIAGWPALFKRLQESSGQPINDIAHEYEYDVGGQGNPKQIYSLRMQSSGEDLHETKYLAVQLGGVDLINDPMHNLRSAEELVDMIIALRNFNVSRLPSLVTDAHGVSAEVQRHAYESDVGGINNFFQIYDTLSWLEVVGTFQAEHGHNLDSGEVITIKTSREGIETGIYTVQKKVVGNRAGVEVTQDGQPFWNYGKPQTSTAEQVVALIEKLRKNFGSIDPGKEFNFSPDNAKPLVASIKDGQTEIKLFVNGTITITGPGVMNMVSMSAEDTDRANELMERILDLTPKQ